MGLLGKLTAAVLGIALLASDPAAAQTCFTLQAELMHLQSRGGFGGSGDRSRYERAYREQANVISRTEMRARNAGCFGGGFFLFRQESDPVCGTLVPKLREMQANLDRLDRLRREGGSGNFRRMRELQAMMQNRGCEVPGGDRFAMPDEIFEPQPRTSSWGTYRTLCVRTCDGYYFPISFSTTPDRLPADAQACQAMCPGTESKLFYHANPGGGPQDMMSIEGEAYASLPTAFQYRTSLAPSCSCTPPGGFASVATQMAGAAMEDTTAPLPRARPAPGEDPETMANRFGHFVPRAVTEGAGDTPVASATGADGRSVRVVGPANWETPQFDDQLIAPVPN